MHMARQNAIFFRLFNVCLFSASTHFRLHVNETHSNAIYQQQQMHFHRENKKSQYLRS